MSRHAKLSHTQGIHSVVAYVYADAAARLGATGFTAEDVGKVARQDDDSTYWVLTAATPAWVQLALGTLVPLATVAPEDVTTTVSEVGVSLSAAREDHKHDVSTAAASALAVGGSSSEGSSVSLARADHAHALPSYGSTAGTFCQGDDARLSNARPPTEHALSHLPGASDGLTVATPVDVSTANAAGIEASFSRSDHVHRLPFSVAQSVLGAATGAVGFNAQKLTGVADPTQAQDAATKAYVDAVAQGLDLKRSVTAIATTSIGTLSGLAQTADDVALSVEGMRVLLTAESPFTQDGIWVVSAAAWTRALDMPEGSSAASAFTFVERGTLYAESGWVCTNDVGSDVVGTNDLVFTQFSGAGQIEAGAALTKTGNRLDVAVAADGSLVIAGDAMGVGVLASDDQHGSRGGGSQHAVATTATAGFASAADKAKLDGIEAGAQVNLPVTSAVVTAAYVAAWAVADWYIDGVTGLDSNNGTTELTPLQTGAELLRRLGPYALWGQSVTVHVLANGMVDALVLHGALLVAGTQLTVIGTPTLLTSDVVQAYAAVSHTTPSATQLTGTAVVDWSPYLNRRFRITSAGTRQGVVAWCAKANPEGLGLNVARISPPLRRDLVSAFGNVASDVFVVGDAFDVESLPAIPAVLVDIDGPMLATAGSSYARRQLHLESIACQQLRIRSVDQMQRGRIFVFGCRLGYVHTSSPATTVQRITQMSGCLFTIDDPNTSSTLYGYGVFESCLFGDAARAFQIIAFSELANCLFQKCRFVANTSNSPILGFNVQVFDVAALSACNLTYGDIQNLSGSGNATIGIAANSNVFLKFRGTCNLQGATTNAQLTTAPTINLTLPQFLQPSDYAQKGTATLVAGTVTVTVPWWDPTKQKLTVSHADWVGVTGELSTPTASQTNTQFTIDSTLATDLSTVNWEISPLGRNIFVSTS